MTTPFHPMHGQPPLTARREAWMDTLLRDSDTCRELLEDYGSPVNVVYPAILRRNAAELVEAGRVRDVDVRVFFARKANKALSFVDEAIRAGHGVDVASYRELSQVLQRGIDPRRVILSAAVKNSALLHLAVSSGVTISVDSRDELCAVGRTVRHLRETGDNPSAMARVAPRIAPDPATLPPTRFGELAETWAEFGVEKEKEIREIAQVVGVHAHLHGYSEADRRIALAGCLEVIDAVRSAGHNPTFIDLGGGVPMSYLDDAAQWEAFTAARRGRLEGESAQEAGLHTWKDNPLATTYPFHQSPTRGEWLGALLDGEIPGFGRAGDALRQRELALHLEPGRSVLDGGGVILARVAFVKKRSDGVDLVGLEMNRTQCKTTSDDILLDPILVPTAEPETGRAHPSAERASRAGMRAYLVGAYCIEDEVIIWRQMTFPQGVAVGDCVAIPNTAGYFMHIVESASHQIPLARNVVCTGEDSLEFAPDDIDSASATA